MVEVLANYVFFPNGIYALAALLVIILLYFLRKKVTVSRLPTIMFLLAQQGKKKYRWFPRIPFNLLLLLYLLIALILVGAIMEPFYHTSASTTEEHSILLIDNSASMQTAERFEQAISQAKSEIGSKTTIIVTSPKPTILLEQGSYIQARSTLTSLKVTDATTPLSQAVDLIQAQDFNEGAIHVFSDFLDDEMTSDELRQRFSILSQFIIVPHPVTEGQNQVGIISAEIGKREIKLLVRNFREYTTAITIRAGGATVETEIPPNDITPITLSLPEVQTKIEIEPKDDLMADNVYYLSAQAKTTKKLLYVTSQPLPFTTAMFDVLDFLTYQTYVPPGTVDTASFDSYVFENVDPALLLPSNVNEALDNVYGGGVLIIKMGNKMRKLQAREEYPFTKVLAKEEATIEFRSEPITQSLTADSEEEVFPIELSEDAIPLIVTENGKAVVAYKKHGQGAIIYYGINDEIIRSEFKQSYAYPILFQRLFKENFHIPTLTDQQKETGDQWIGEGVIIHESGETYELPTTLERAGFYTYQGSTYGVNLLSLSESQTKFTESLEEINATSTDSKVRQSLLFILIIVASVLIFIEIFYLKKRGEY